MKILLGLSLVLWGVGINSAQAGIEVSCKEYGKTFTTVMPAANDNKKGYNNYLVKGDTSCFGLYRHIGKFKIRKDSWGIHYGYYTRCNPNKPFNRLLRSLDLMEKAKSSLNGSAFLNSIYSYSSGASQNFYLGCAFNKDDAAAGVHFHKDRGRRREIVIYQNAFRNGPAYLAGLVIHEARHKDKFHDGEDKCPRKASCDSSWYFNGANTYQTKFYIDMGMLSYNIPKRIRQRALDRAKYRINNTFVEKPQIRVATTAPDLSIPAPKSPALIPARNTPVPSRGYRYYNGPGRFGSPLQLR